MEEKTEKKKLNKNTIIALILIISGIGLYFIWPDINTGDIISFICAVLFLIAVIFSSIALCQKLKKGKVLTIISLIISILLMIYSVVSGLSFMILKDINITDEVYCTQTELIYDCIDNNDGTSTCKAKDLEGMNIPCSTDKLKEIQFKK